MLILDIEQQNCISQYGIVPLKLRKVPKNIKRIIWDAERSIGSMQYLDSSIDDTITALPEYLDLPIAYQRACKQGEIQLAYEHAITLPVFYTSMAGIAKEYQADLISQNNLSKSIAGCQKDGITPDKFFWVSQDNTRVPFCYEDLLGLASAIYQCAYGAFIKYQNLKQDIEKATTPKAVTAIVW